MTEGYIKLFRNIENWEWYTEPNVMRLFIHCLLRANHSSKKWRGITIDAGSFVTSYSKLAQDLKLSEQNIRTSLKHLKSTGELTLKTTSQYSLISINNWHEYQQINTQTNIQLTGDQHTTNTRLTTNNNDKNEKNNTTTIYSENFQKLYGQYNNVCLTAEQYNRLLGMCADKKFLDELVDSFSENIEAGNEKPYKAEFPNAHFIRLKKYRDYRMNNPQKFINSVKKRKNNPNYCVTKFDDPIDRKHIFEELEAEAKAKGLKII